MKQYKCDLFIAIALVRLKCFLPFRLQSLFSKKYWLKKASTHYLTFQKTSIEKCFEIYNCNNDILDLAVEHFFSSLMKHGNIQLPSGWSKAQLALNY